MDTLFSNTSFAASEGDVAEAHLQQGLAGIFMTFARLQLLQRCDQTSNETYFCSRIRSETGEDRR